jgi:hypothetical protein
LITAEDITNAEKVLQVRGDIGGMRAVFATADVDKEAVGEFVSFCIRHRLPKSIPDLDPRLEPPLNTLLVHAFFVGILCGRDKGRTPA